jgi:formamidopyrimidine-DNA glycosylase
VPELPEVEAVCRKLRAEAAGAPVRRLVIQRRRITSPDDPARVEAAAAGRTLDAIDRVGKNILLRLGPVTLHAHLRMTGNLCVIPDHRLRPAAASAWFELACGRGIVFEDPRGLGTLRLLDGPLPGLGPEPLDPGFTAERFVAAARASRQPAKLFLMDQRKVAGIGNIYAAEALFHAGIDPRRPIGRIAPRRLAALHAVVVRVLNDAVQFAYITYSRPGGFREADDYTPAVYGREGESCVACGTPIRRVAQGGRSTYFCPKCQR